MTIKHKVFAAYSVLTAADVNTYLMNQDVVNVTSVSDLASIPTGVNMAWVETGSGAVGQVYARTTGSTWRLVGPYRTIVRQWADAGTGLVLTSGGAGESGFGTIPAQASFTVPRTTRIHMQCQFRANPVAAGIASIKMDGVQVGNTGIFRQDHAFMIHGVVDVAAGTHVASARVDTSGGNVTWVNYYMTLTEGVTE